ncbi:DUF2911 domain-containing protein [Aridibaculum aurantiacum]|uniref:DUF2911 domain-containing protein n=1 Tax=Aridibaculum aurantiacum TaxID=2810307 RepID=UPI001A976229|nr:DUF2911 domain-containing protein [Aridibaculum aurantiacum]
MLAVLSIAVQAQKEDVCYNPNLVKDTTKKSIKSVAEAKIGAASFTVNYHSPGVRKRIIWGGLVPLDEVWVTGAHDATRITFDKDVMIGNKKVTAGTYAFFTIPGKNTWTLIINKNFNQHLASEYEAGEDVVRVNVKPQKAAHLERLQYFIEPAGTNKGNLAVRWEKVKVTLPVTVL